MVDDPLRSREDKQLAQGHSGSDEQACPSPAPQRLHTCLTLLSPLPTPAPLEATQTWMDNGEFLF